MKRIAILSIAVAWLWLTALLAVIPAQEHPPRPGQPEFCVMNHKDPKYICKCMDADQGKGCVVHDGRRGRNSEEGMAGICASHCRISHCHCCLS